MKRIGIVGAGPAGTVLALSLVREGVDPADVVLIDKARFPRPKVCAGGITFRGTEFLSALLGRPLGGTETRGIEMRSPLGSMSMREPNVQWVYDRGLLDSALVDACRARGIEVREDQKVVHMERRGNGWSIATATGARDTFQWIAGCDGANGVVRRAARLRGGRTGRLVEGIFERVDASVDPRILYVDFAPISDDLPGYAWIFPYPSPNDGGEYFKIGVMDARGRMTGDVLRRWTTQYATRRGFRLIEPKIAGWPERYFDRGVEAHCAGLVLVGEAWGIDPLLGEGIAPSMFMADYAARRLRRALDQGSGHLRDYELRFLLCTEGRNLWLQARLADRLYGAHAGYYLRVLFGMKHLRHLGSTGALSYGRLLGWAPAVAVHYALQVAREGVPSKGTVVRSVDTQRVATTPCHVPEVLKGTRRA